MTSQTKKFVAMIKLSIIVVNSCMQALVIQKNSACIARKCRLRNTNQNGASIRKVCEFGTY